MAPHTQDWESFFFLNSYRDTVYIYSQCWASNLSHALQVARVGSPQQPNLVQRHSVSVIIQPIQTRRLRVEVQSQPQVGLALDPTAVSISSPDGHMIVFSIQSGCFDFTGTRPIDVACLGVNGDILNIRGVRGAMVDDFCNRVCAFCDCNTLDLNRT